MNVQTVVDLTHVEPNRIDAQVGGAALVTAAFGQKLRQFGDSGRRLVRPTDAGDGIAGGVVFQ